jgi:hypothetical protein
MFRHVPAPLSSAQGAGQPPANQPPREEVDKMDVDVTYETVRFGLTSLNDETRGLIMKKDSHLYEPMHVGEDSEGEPYREIDTAKIYSLRGRDINNDMLPPGFGAGMINAIVVAGEWCAGQHMQSSYETAMEREDVKAPATGESTGEAAGEVAGKAAGKAATDKDVEMIDAQPKVKADRPPPALDECVKVSFHLDTQTPNIEFLGFRTDKKSQKVQTFSCRLFGQDLAYSAEDVHRVGFTVEKYVPDPSVDTQTPGDEPEPLGKQAIEKMSQTLEKTCVMKVTILPAGPIIDRKWTGLSQDQLDQIRDNVVPDRNDALENLVRCLEDPNKIELYFTCKTVPEHVARWGQKFAPYFRDLMTLTNVYGNFPFYQLHCSSDKRINDGKAILEAELPATKFPVPRHLVQEWSFTQKTEDGVVTLSNPQPYTWAPLEFPTSGYQEPREAAFLLKLAAKSELDRQARDLKELVQSDGTKWFKGRFRKLDKKQRTYAVEVYLNLEAEMATRGVKMPKPGNRIHLEVDRINDARPSKKSIAKLDGVVVYDALGTSASFVCVVDVNGKNLHLGDNERDYHVFISYLVDDVPHTRMLEGIAKLQTALDNELAFGPDSRVVIFDCAGRSGSTNSDILMKETSPEQREQFKAAVEAIKPPSNPSQMNAALRTCLSPTGNVFIVGPPGTGKTNTLIKTGYAHWTLGRRVMYTAPMNSNVHTLLQKFMDSNAILPADKQLQDHEWVLFTGGYTKISKAEALSRKQSEGEYAESYANEKIVGYLKDAKARLHVPHYESTLGHKLKMRIQQWAADEKFEEDGGIHSLAKSYLDTQSKLPSLADEEQVANAKTHLRNLEYNFSVKFLQQVKFCFCTVSTSGHELLQESGIWDLLIIDEAARESRTGLAVALGSLAGRVKGIQWTGDKAQGSALVVGEDSNVGYNLLARGVFAHMAQVNSKDRAIPCEVVMLDTCYRMTQDLINWSSRWCYDNKVKSDRSVGDKDLELRNMLGCYWRTRLHDDYKGSHMQIGLDCTQVGVKDQQSAGSTTRFNKDEADLLVATIIDMLNTDPPADFEHPIRRIRGEDICIISNYVGQISQCQKSMREVMEAQKISIKQEDLDAIWYKTTTVVQGDERPITFYSIVIAPGVERLPMKDTVPIGFVANQANLNVSITRCKVARYIVGALQSFMQMKKDGHSLARNKRNVPFFDLINDLQQTHSAISLEDSHRWIMQRSKPEFVDSLNRKLQSAAVFDQEPAPKAAPTNPNAAQQNKGNGKKTTAKNTFKPAPAGTKFAGDRDDKGHLKAAKKNAPKGVTKERTFRRGKGGGGKKRAKAAQAQQDADGDKEMRDESEDDEEPLGDWAAHMDKVDEKRNRKDRDDDPGNLGWDPVTTGVDTSAFD